MTSTTDMTGMKNPSVLLYGPGKASIKDQPIPELGERDVLVRIAFVGVCGSDVCRPTFPASPSPQHQLLSYPYPTLTRDDRFISGNTAV